MRDVVLRCTAKVLKLLGRPRDLVTAEPTDQDWNTDLLWLDKHDRGSSFPVDFAESPSSKSHLRRQAG